MRAQCNTCFSKGPAATKYRKGACENCGAITHPTRDCVERPRKKGAKWTGKNIQADEIVQDVDLDWDEKRDRWNGYNPKEHDKVVEEYERIEEQRRKMKAAELDKQGLISSEEAKKIVEGGNSGFSDDEYGDDEEKYADQADMPGQHVNTKTRTTIRNLRYVFVSAFHAFVQYFANSYPTVFAKILPNTSLIWM
jgi:pre-mRNA-processing factor SLU7